MKNFAPEQMKVVKNWPAHQDGGEPCAEAGTVRRRYPHEGQL